MALTKVTGDFIKAGSITQGHLHSSHGITTTHIAEGDKLFFTNARVDSRVGSLSTSNLSEGTNLYYTNARADARIALQVGSNLDLSSKSTSDLSEGTNLYYTQARFNTAFTAKSTSDLSEGTNLYYTNARADARIAAASTSDLSEGTNLYYTDARADARITAADTDSLSEGSTNLYYTDARADARVALIVDSAPGTLNTLNELAAALGDDANFSTTVTNSIATKLPLAGGTLTGALSGTSATFSGIGQFAGAIRITETGTAQHILIGNQDSAGANKPAMIRSANASLEFGYGNSWSGEGGTMTTTLQLHANSNASFAGNATFTGTITASGYNDSNWNTAYGWGNHGAVGYLTSFDITTQTDAKYIRSDADDTASGIITLTKNTATGLANSTFSHAKTIIGGIHFANGAGANNNGKQAAITFQGSTASEAQAGIYVHNNNSQGTHMMFATTNSYATGPQAGITLLNNGNVTIRGTVGASNFSGSSSGTNTGDQILPTDFVSKANGGTFSGAVTIEQNGDALNLRSTTNSTKPRLTFSSDVPDDQIGHIEYTHNNTASYGSGEAFIIGGTESTTTILADGKLMYNEGIYSKPASGTGAGTRKDSNWDTAYTYSQVGHLPLAGGTITSGTNIGLTINHNTFEKGLVIHRNHATNAASIVFKNNTGMIGTLLAISSDNQPYWQEAAGTDSYKIWHDNNDGSGSGLDADLLDGVQGSSYLRSDTSDTFNGTLTMGGTLALQNNSISGVNHITINDAGVNEGISWSGGNNWYIQECPDAMTNAAGNLQISTGTTRRFTVDTSGNVEAPTGVISAGNHVAINCAQWASSGASTGAIKITLPGSTSNHSMPIIRVSTYEYNSRAHVIYTISGHNWSTASYWYNTGVTSEGSDPLTVRLGHDGSTHCIVIGDTNTTWSYGHVTVELLAHPQFYSNNQDMTVGWGASQITSLPSTLTTVGVGKIWHSNNDGSTSGLDADLVDGYHAAQTYTSTGNAAGSYLGGHYSGGGTEKPNSGTFGAGKLKLAMLGSSNLGFGGSWNDVLWMSSYNGGDVKRSTALVSSKYDNTSLWVVKQNYDSSSWGTGYLIPVYGVNPNAGSLYANTFYDSNATSYYADPNATSVLKYLGRKDHGEGLLVGGYNNIGASHAKTNPIFAIGSSYLPGEASLSNMYGIGYTRGDASFCTGTNGWGMYVAADGNSRIFLDGQNGGIGTANNSWRAPIFYDSDNTAFYVDPSNGSNGVSANLQGRIQVGTFSSSQANTGEAWIGRASDRTAGILTVQLGTGTGRRFEVVDYNWTTVEFSADDSGVATAAASFRAPIFYDSNDTNSYFDSSEIVLRHSSPQIALRDTDHRSVVLHNNSNRFYVLGAPVDSTSYAQINGVWPWYVQLDTNDVYTGSVGYAGASYRAPIFYDRNNTGYYVHGDSGSRLLRLGLNVAPDMAAAGDILKIQGGNNGLGCIKAISGSYSYGVRIEGNNLSTQLACYSSSTAQTTQINFENSGNSSAGKISTTGNSTAYTTSSDYRLKENVIPISNSIYRLNQLNPSRFNFIGEPNKTVDGFIAHEVQDIVPEAIVGEKDEVDNDGNPIYQGIDQAKLVPLLVAAIKELEARVQELENN